MKVVSFKEQITRRLNIENLSPKNLGKADIHIHSNYSDAKNSIEIILEYVENKTDLDVIAICDHDTIDGAVEAQLIAKRRGFRFEVIVGEEISTRQGHIVGLFLKEAIPHGLSAPETLKLIKNQNGVTVAPHPFFHTRLRSRNRPIMDGVGFITLIRDKADIDAIEIINASLNITPTKENLRARFLNDTLLFKAEVGASDAHILDAIGKGYTIFEGKTAADLKVALENGQTRAMSQKWTLMSLIRYGFFFLPIGLRVFFYTLVRGRRKKRLKLIGVDDETLKSMVDH